jgi:predicted HAD superfamily phosphohydrolase YqeG
MAAELVWSKGNPTPQVKILIFAELAVQGIRVLVCSNSSSSVGELWHGSCDVRIGIRVQFPLSLLRPHSD